MKKLPRYLTAILSLIVMLSVLSTATYAWYSAINRAVTNSISFTASQNKGGGDLSIGWSIANTTTFELNFEQPSQTFYPMIPMLEAEVDITSMEYFVSGNFNSSNQVKNALDEWICSVSGQSATPYVCKGDNDGVSQSHFYLTNRSIDFDLEVSIVYNITGGSLADKLRVAVFVGNTPQTQVLKGILAKENDVHYGTINVGDKVAEIPIMTEAYRDNFETKFDIAKNGAVVISLVAWLDGAVMTDDDADLSVEFAMVFDGTPKV